MGIREFDNQSSTTKLTELINGVNAFLDENWYESFARASRVRFDLLNQVATKHGGSCDTH